MKAEENMNERSITITLRAILVGNGIPSANRNIKTKVGIINSKDIRVDNIEEAKYSVHKFTLSSDNPVAKKLIKITDDKELATVFEIALSLINTRAFFTTIISKDSDDFVKRPISQKLVANNEVSQKSQTNQNKNKSITINEEVTAIMEVKIGIMAPLEIDEREVWNVLVKLIPYFMPNSGMNTLREIRIEKSIENYRSAIDASASDEKSCYRSLYDSFEQAVNSVGEEVQGERFDKKASEITKIDKNKIEKLRKFNNLIKHPLKSKRDIKELENYEKNFYSLIQSLKKATSRTILSRL